MSMMRVVAGAAGVYSAMLAALVVLARWRGGADVALDAWWVLAVVVVPAMGAWLGTELVQWVSPRRVLDRRSGRRVAQVVHGSAGGVVGAAAIVGMVPVVHLAVPDAVVTAAGGLAGAVVAGLVRRRVRAGMCAACGYSLVGLGKSMDEARCPECGRVVDEEELGILGGERTGPCGVHSVRSKLGRAERAAHSDGIPCRPVGAQD